MPIIKFEGIRGNPCHGYLFSGMEMKSFVLILVSIPSRKLCDFQILQQ
jgi:hypothetical protein